MTNVDDHFVGRYLQASDGKPPAVPTLADSLAVFSGLAALPEATAPLPARCNCLIQGYTAPRNGHALREFLSAAGVSVASITAVDLLDLPAIYGRLGLNLPAITFLQGDAGNLGARFADGAFDVVVQDFILNCAPPAQAERLLAEARRLLSGHGLALISFTDSSGLASLPVLHPEDLRSRWAVAWNAAASDLPALVAGAPDAPFAAEALTGRLIYDPERRQYTCLTRPHGRFEFFVPLERTLRQIAEAGLEIIAMATETGEDDNGLVCVRHRCIARVAELENP